MVGATVVVVVVNHHAVMVLVVVVMTIFSLGAPQLWGWWTG